MKREQRWEMKYIVTMDGEQIERVCYPRSEEQRDANKQKCKELGYKVVSCKKLYPFSTMKNQHNFELIHNIVMCDLYDIWNGEKSVSDEEYARLEELKEKSEKFFCLPLPVAWLTWEDWKDAKEISESAIVHRQDACIRAGRPDLVTYCV